MMQDEPHKSNDAGSPDVEQLKAEVEDLKAETASLRVRVETLTAVHNQLSTSIQTLAISPLPMFDPKKDDFAGFSLGNYHSKTGDQ